MNFTGHSLDKENIGKLKKQSLPVIIFGAGIIGETLFHLCREFGIKVECFCDNDTIKIKRPVCGVEVLHTQSLNSRYKSANFLIATADIKDVVDQLRCLGYLNWYAISSLLRDLDLLRYTFNESTDFIEYVFTSCILCQDNYLSPDKLFIRSVDIIITERCSLKCRDCSNLMQYYKKPSDCNIEELLRSIDLFCTIVDEINEFRIIGGEPLMNKEWPLIIRKLTEEPKIKKILIYTNGTILPGRDQVEYLKKKKIIFYITDYGVYSRKVDDLVRLLRHNDIGYYVQKAISWTDCAKIKRHDRSVKELKDIFRSCCSKNLITLSGSRLYRCPFAANAARLLAVPDYKDDYVDIFQELHGAADISKVKNKVRALLLDKDLLRVCDYCNGRPYGAPEIRPAIQVNRPLAYEQFL